MRWVQNVIGLEGMSLEEHLSVIEVTMLLSFVLQGSLDAIGSLTSLFEGIC